MKATHSLISKTLRPFAKPFPTTPSVRRFRAPPESCSELIRPILRSAPKYADYQFMIGSLPDMTMCLLTAPLTTEQRQAFHAQNFNNLSTAACPVYLHCVAYAIGYTVISNGRRPQSAMIAEHLADVIVTSIYNVPAIPPEDSQRLAELLFVVHTKMKELNRLISTAVVNNTSYQRAMYAGVVHSFWWWGDLGY